MKYSAMPAFLFTQMLFTEGILTFLSWLLITKSGKVTHTGCVSPGAARARKEGRRDRKAKGQ